VRLGGGVWMGSSAGVASSQNRQIDALNAQPMRPPYHHQPRCPPHPLMSESHEQSTHLVAQQSVVHKDAVQPVAQHPVHQCGSHCAVHTT
jgi:hypothetical protein